MYKLNNIYNLSLFDDTLFLLSYKQLLEVECNRLQSINRKSSDIKITLSLFEINYYELCNYLFGFEPPLYSKKNFKKRRKEKVKKCLI